MYKYLIVKLRDYIFIILTATIFLFFAQAPSLSEKNVFIIENVNVKDKMDINFSRDKYIDKGFTKSFNILMSKVLLSKDFDKIKNIKAKEVKNLINSFQILEEKFSNEDYELKLRIFYNEIKVKKLLEKNNVSFSQPTNIDAIFFPIFFEGNEMKDFNNNYFYKNWISIEIKNELINFILPLEDLEDISKLREMKNKIEDLNVDDFVNKYDVKNYVFSLFEYKNKKLKVHLKTNFNSSKMSKNIFYKIDDIKNKSKLNEIIKDLKMKITDIWKKENIINLSIPLFIRVKFNFKSLSELEKIKETLNMINIIDRHEQEELNINNSFFKIYYYGSPKRLQNELLKFDYKLRNDQIHWTIYKND